MRAPTPARIVVWVLIPVSRGAVDTQPFASIWDPWPARTAVVMLIVSYRIRKKSGDTDPANGVILREAPRKALRPRESLAPTEESLRWAHHPVGYDRLWREKPRPFPIKILPSAHRLPRVADGSGCASRQDDSDRPQPLFLRIRYHPLGSMVPPRPLGSMRAPEPARIVVWMLISVSRGAVASAVGVHLGAQAGAHRGGGVHRRLSRWGPARTRGRRGWWSWSAWPPQPLSSMRTPAPHGSWCGWSSFVSRVEWWISAGRVHPGSESGACRGGGAHRPPQPLGSMVQPRPARRVVVFCMVSSAVVVDARAHSRADGGPDLHLRAS
jgi:hypothetical protein